MTPIYFDSIAKNTSGVSSCEQHSTAVCKDPYNLCFNTGYLQSALEVWLIL